MLGGEPGMNVLAEGCADVLICPPVGDGSTVMRCRKLMYNQYDTHYDQAEQGFGMRAEVPFDFYTQQPGEGLAECVESIWYARGTVPYKQEKIAPTGSVVAIFILGDAIEQTPATRADMPVRSTTGLLIGPHDGPVTNRPIGETHAVGIVATPVGCERLFGVRPATLRGDVVELLGVWPAAAELRDRLLRLDSGAEKTAVLHDYLQANLGVTQKGADYCRAAIEMLEADPQVAISDVAARLEVAPGELDRVFARVVGLSPRALSNLLRMRGVLENLDVAGDVDWSSLAQEHGWFDQPHFIRSFKRHTGHTPTQYVAAQRAVFDADGLGDAAGFVPEI